jgi:cobalt-zinc-cadmium efflux system outer membrane protein
MTAKFAGRAAAFAALAISSFAASVSAEAPNAPMPDQRLTEPLDRRTVLRAALERNPAARVWEQKARAMRAAARAEGSLPAPEVMGQVWQVPFSRPAAWDTQMIMIGVSQNFPAIGARSAREQSMAAEADAEQAMAKGQARSILRDAGHAFADYQESTAKHRIHRAHLSVTEHIFQVAEGRHAAGGSLIDVVRAQVEMSRVEADFVTDATLIESARAHLNALLAREPGAPLGPAVETEPVVPSLDVAVLVARAHAARPEFEQVAAERQARVHALRAAEREATWPSFSLGALYFPPTSAVREHSYGATVSLSLPWLWGAAAGRQEAEQEYLRAASTNLEATKIPVDAEVVTAESKARSAAYRLEVLRDRTLPASHRAFEAAQAGFESGRTDLMTVLDARRLVVDMEQDIVLARSDLEHALTDLEAAVGAEVPTRPLGSLDAKVLGGTHVQ